MNERRGVMLVCLLLLGTALACGQITAQIAQILERNPSLFVLYAVDLEVGESGVLANVVVTTERALSAVTMDMYLDSGQDEASLRVVFERADTSMLGPMGIGSA